MRFLRLRAYPIKIAKIASIASTTGSSMDICFGVVSGSGEVWFEVGVLVGF